VNTPRLVKADAVAEMLDVDRFRVYELARTGQIPAVRIGRSIRFNPERVVAWIEAGGTAANGDEAA
jgi:excisionase family DNA binding protein